MKCYIHGVIHSMVKPDEVFEKLFTENGRIVGLNDDYPITLCDEIIDLRGGHLYPGFVDAHLHLLGYGEYLEQIHLNHLKTKEEIFHILDHCLDKDIIIGLGYENIGLTKLDLDERYPNHMIILRHHDFHGVTVNSKVLKTCDMDDELGILKEQKAASLMKKLPRKSYVTLKHMLEKAIEELYRYGITGGHSDDLFYFNGFDETYRIFQDVLKDKPFRTHLLIHHEVLNRYLEIVKKWGIQTDYLEFGAVKMFYDGTMSSKTALMSSKYKKMNTHGEVVLGKDVFEKVLKNVREHNLTAAIHVIGDQGLEEVIDLLKANPPLFGLYDRVIHAPWAKNDSLQKLSELPVHLDIQPQFLSSDLPKAFSYFSKQPELIFPWESYLNKGLIISGSSDAPVEIPNPLLGMKDAIFRRSSSDQKQYMMNESLSYFEAIKLYTTYSHAQSKLQPRGFIKKGYLADFTVCDQDLLRLSELEFNEHHITMTIVNDIIVYSR